MKKILYIVEAMGGGLFTYIVGLANQICNEYEVYIAYAVRPQTPKNYKEYFDKEIKLIEVKNFTRQVNLIKDVKAFFEIRRIAKNIKPDIIHLHSSKAGTLGRWAFNGRKVPMFYTPHGYSFLMQDNGWVKRTLYRTIESVSSKRYCTTISCSLGEHNETLRLTKRATYVNNGIDTVAMQQIVERCLPSKKVHPFIVFTLGRISYAKNPELFNDVAERMSNVKFLWIGDGELRETLKSPNIEVTGWVSRDEALEYSTNADLFILTSLWEGLPIALLEAMYMKKICVVSDVIGNHDVIKNKVNGFVCKSADEFVDIIRKMSVCPDSKVIANAYQDVLFEYSNSIMDMKYKNIYSQLSQSN